MARLRRENKTGACITLRPALLTKVYLQDLLSVQPWTHEIIISGVELRGKAEGLVRYAP